MKLAIRISLSTITLILMSITGYSFASSYDCNLVQNGVSLNAYQNEIQNTIYNSETMTTALKHLASYCCKRGYLGSDSSVCKDSANDAGGAESPYLFDHLINLSFRRLDGFEDASLRYNLPADPAGSDWQKEIKKFNDPAQLTIPQTIIDTFTSDKYWQEKAGKTIPDNKCILDNNIFNGLTLKNKYEASCNIAKCIVSLHPIATVTNSVETSLGLVSDARYDCQSIAANRFQKEAVIVKQLITRVGIRTVVAPLEQYTKNYFVGTRWQNLYEQRATFDQSLTFVNRKIQEGTPACSN